MVIALFVGGVIFRSFSVSYASFADAVLTAGFNGGNHAARVLVLGPLVEADIDGRWVVAGVALQTLGFAFGAAMAAMISGNNS